MIKQKIKSVYSGYPVLAISIKDIQHKSFQLWEFLTNLLDIFWWFNGPVSVYLVCVLLNLLRYPSFSGLSGVILLQVQGKVTPP